MYIIPHQHVSIGSQVLPNPIHCLFSNLMLTIATTVLTNYAYHHFFQLIRHVY